MLIILILLTILSCEHTCVEGSISNSATLQLRQRVDENEASGDVVNSSEAVKSDVCKTGSEILDLLLANYSKTKLPIFTGIDMVVEMWIQEISSVSEVTSDFDLDLYMSEIWMDPGLRYSHLNPCKTNVTVTHEIYQRIWTPNSCFMNSKYAYIHESPFKNIFLMIYENGTVWVNYRATVKGPCNIDLTKFPMDTQTCYLTYFSFNYNTDEVRMNWNFKSLAEPAFVLKKVVLPEFQLTKIKSIQRMMAYPAGNWTELDAMFTFERRYVWYFLQAYIPTYLTIFISWVSFTLGAKAIPARTMLGVNSLLAQMFQFGNIMKNLPRVSYVKAIDVWMLACMTFVFCSLVELALVGYLARDVSERGGRKRRKNSEAFRYGLMKGSPLLAAMAPAGAMAGSSPQPPDQSPPSARGNGPLPSAGPAIVRSLSSLRHFNTKIETWWTVDNIDKTSSVAFPALFGLFNVIYWTYYITL